MTSHPLSSSTSQPAAERPVSPQTSLGASSRASVLVVLAALPLLVYLVAPILGLLARTTPGVWQADVCCAQAALALRLSLMTATIATLAAVCVGMPVAYLLAHHRFRGRVLVDTLIDLPLVLPPAAAGFEAVPPELTSASRTLGASQARSSFLITVLLSSHALLAGVVMTWARALGEFGATLVFAGAFPGRTETMPIAIYTAGTTNLPAAIALAATLAVVSFGVLVAARRIAGVGTRLTPAGLG